MRGVVAALMLCLPLVARGDLPQTVSRIKPAIVAVGTYLPTRNPPFKFMGTGFVVGDGQAIATNAHVLQAPLEDAALERWAIAIPRLGTRAEVRGVDVAARAPAYDIAILRQRGAPLPALRLADEDSVVREGETLSFTGYPIGTVLGLFPVTHRALVSALSPIALPKASAQSLAPRDIRMLEAPMWTVIQLDATAYPGNSGSPLFDPHTGEVVGIINMVFVKGSRESALSQPSGITFAIPSRHLSRLLREMRGDHAAAK